MTDSNLKEYYQTSEVAEDYDKIRFRSVGGQIVDNREKGHLKKFLEKVPKGSRILEVAPGTGRFSVMMAQMGYKLTLMDASEAMLNVIRGKLNRLDKKQVENVELKSGDAANLPFEDNTFDAVVSVRFIWHYKDFTKFADEMLRVTKPGGRIFLDFMNVWSLRLLFNWLASRSIYVSLEKKDHIKKYVSESKAETEAVEYDFLFPYVLYRATPAPVARLLDLVERILAKTPVKRLSTIFYIQIKKK